MWLIGQGTVEAAVRGARGGPLRGPHDLERSSAGALALENLDLSPRLLHQTAVRRVPLPRVHHLHAKLLLNVFK